MKLTSSLRRGSLAAFVIGTTVLATTGATHAALITWGAPTNISGDSDVSTAGALVGAFNMGNTGVASTTVNGVTFAPFALTGPPGSIGNFSFTGTTFGGNNALGAVAGPFTALTAPYQSLLSSAVITGVTGLGNITLTMNGLVVGSTYDFQWWSSTSQAFPGFETTLASSPGSNVSLDKNVGDATGNLGQWVLGTFTADSASQAITFTSNNRPVLNGFQLRQLSSVPEPGTALAGVSLLGLCGMQRRRR
jgi:PEP-CTERM motif